MKLPASKEPVIWNTNKWCCNELKNNRYNYRYSYKGLHIEFESKYNIYTLAICKYCPFCGEKFDDQKLQLEIHQQEINKPDEKDYREYCILTEYIKDPQIDNIIKEIIHSGA